MCIRDRLTAAIWGFAFVAQRVGMGFLGAFTFNGIRSVSYTHLDVYKRQLLEQPAF